MKSSLLALPALPTIICCLISGMCVPRALIAQTNTPDLTQASLEDLMRLQITTVSKKEQSLSSAGGSVFVITQDDIRRSGAVNVPDLLRMVPGVNVARINANSWAISIRGFNSRYSGKVLVLVDGRAVYTPLFSGVFWDQQSMPLENIERIEVIRGPGGTVWGANAMNGVINIITKSAKDTQGGLVTVEAGSQDRTQELVQYGGKAGGKGFYRVYGRYTLNTDSPSSSGTRVLDSGHSSQMGFRSDWTLSPRDKVTLQGDILGTSENQLITTLFSNKLPDYYTFNDGVRAGTGNLLGRWNHVYSNGSDTTLQVYYNRNHRFEEGSNVENTADVDFQYHFRAGARNDIVAGLGYRFTDQSWLNGYEVHFGTGHRQDQLFNSFVQDELRLTKSLALTMGVKLEHNSYSGFEIEPSVQLVYSAGSRQTVWASASRAIQQPSWLYTAAQIDVATSPLPGGGFAVFQVSGQPHAESPSVIDYELGYRTGLSKRLTLDATIFSGQYRNLQTVEPQTPYFTLDPAPPHLVLPSVFGNFGRARTFGMEASGHYAVTKWWRINPGISLMRTRPSQESLSKDQTFTATFGDSPSRQAQLRSTMNLPHHLEWDASVYYVGALASGPVPAYTRLDTRLGWRVGEFFEISVAGQNLLTRRHLEFFDTVQLTPTQVGRDIVAKITWRH